MMKNWLHIAFFLVLSTCYGQTLNINLSSEEVQIGEPFTLTYAVISDQEIENVNFQAETGFISGNAMNHNQQSNLTEDYELEILQPFEDTLFKENGEFIWKGSYELIAWDSAYVAILPKEIKFNDSIYAFPAGLVYVSTPPADPTKPLYDINEEFTELPEKNAFVKWFEQNYIWVVILAVFVVALIIFLKKRSRKAPPELSIRELTLAQIDQLEKTKGYEVNLKEYYFSLSLILRRFFAAHYQDGILDKTTFEIELFLKKKGLSKELIALTKQLLMQSDMVKFAKSEPALNEIQKVTNDARSVVDKVTKFEINKDE
ncbi:hypothetical protein [Brumimicrobium aurantiacum]|nr:hypothetical protein [Brumimicrobium aurantiacum]